MKTKNFVYRFGAKQSVNKAAEYLGVHPQTIYRWGDVVPEKYAHQISYDLGIHLEPEDYEKDGAE